MLVTRLTPPKEEDERGLRARIERRFELIADATALMDSLFELFLRRRTAHDWPRELGAMRAGPAGSAVRSSVRAASA